MEYAQGCQLSYTGPGRQAGRSLRFSLARFPSVGEPEGLGGRRAPFVSRPSSMGPCWVLLIEGLFPSKDCGPRIISSANRGYYATGVHFEDQLPEIGLK